MLISRALAGHGVTDTGSSGGGDALLIILGVGITFAIVYTFFKRWRKRKAMRDGDGEPEEK
jgi:hypothetical protein